MSLYKYHIAKPTADAVVQKNDDKLAINIVGDVQLIDSDGNPLLMPGTSGLQLPKGDYVVRADVNATTETWTYKTGGSSGTTTGVITIVYTSNVKNLIASVTSSIV